MISCLVCGDQQGRARYPGILECQTCGFVYADMELDWAAATSLYSREYFAGDEYLDYVSDREILQKNFALRLRELERHVDPARHRSLLEVGCAYGFFLDLAKEKFEPVMGVDICEDAVTYACNTFGVSAAHGDFLAHDFAGQKYDVVCMWDTIEHLLRPDLYLERIADMTEAGALLSITTGDIGSLNARFRGKNWRLLHPPTHLYYFSIPTMRRLLDRMGFDVIHSSHCGFYRSTENILHNLRLFGHTPGWLRWLIEQPLRVIRQVYLNLFDVLYVVAVKR